MAGRWRRFLQRWHPEGIPWPGTVLYNALSRRSIFQRHYQLVAEDVARSCATGRILDIGTGPGWLLLALHQTLPQADLVGVDISPGMVETAKRNLNRAGGSALIEVREAAANSLPFPDGSFDAVVSTGSLHHWKDPVGGLNEVFRVLKPGGHALMYDLVRTVPPEVARAARREFGRLATSILWLHSFEEPFYSPEDMQSLAERTRFQRGATRFVGALCCLVLRRNPAPG